MNQLYEYIGLSSWVSGKRLHLPMQERQEMWVRALGQKEPLEEEMAMHSSILDGNILWTEKGSSVWGCRVDIIVHT